MRSTISFDPEVHRLVVKAMKDNSASFKDTVNEAIRRGLAKPARGDANTLVLKTFALGLLPGYDPSGLNRLLDEQLSEDAAEKLRQSS
jgi:hypothetical protein